MNRKIVLRLPIICLGILMILVAVFAFQIGIDNNPEWGPKRFQIAGLGALFILLGFFYWLFPAISQVFSMIGDRLIFLNWKNKKNDGAGPPLLQKIYQLRLVEVFARYRTDIFLVLLIILGIWVYLWILTAGRMEQWPSGKNYYNLLAEAFRNGQVHLLLEPSSELLALEDPYNYRNRENIPQLWDASLYGGKYYLYWGPAPALIGMVVSVMTSEPVSDANLVLGFSVAAVCFSLLLLKRLWQDFNYPAWIFFGTTVTLLFNAPMLWLLTRPSVYEASIAGGQAFSVAGLYFGYCFLQNNQHHKGFLILMGFSLGLAGGTRTNLLISAATLALLMAFYLPFLYKKQLKKLILSLVALGAPLVTIFSGLLVYNYARFGSIFEFGHRYQLTGPALPANYQNVSAFEYVLPNAFTYIFRLPALSQKFPYVTIPWIKEPMWPSFIRLPENYYYSEPTAGVLFIVPFIGFTVLLFFRFVWLFLDGEINLNTIKENGLSKSTSWLFLSLIAYITIQMSVLLVFISSSLRYLFDVTIPLVLLSALFVAVNFKKLTQGIFQNQFLAFFWLFISLFSAILGILIGLTGSNNHFLNQNPQLFNILQNFFH